MFTLRCKNQLPYFVLGLALFGFQNCIFQTKEEPVAGGAEDFPNTVALGAAVSEHIVDHAEWNQFSIIPSTLPSFADVDSLVVTPEANALAKGNALAKTHVSTKVYATDSLSWDFSDTASLKIIRRFRMQESLLKIYRDTSIFQYDENIKGIPTTHLLWLEARGVEIWKAKGAISGTSRLQTYLYENLDSNGGFDRGTFYERIPGIGGTIKHKYLIMLPGPDRDLNTKIDNRPRYYAFAKTLMGLNGIEDTTEAFQFNDADGDSALWGEGDSGIVDFVQKVTKPNFRPSIERITQKMRAVLFKEGLKTYPISFEETRTEMDGKKAVFSVKGTRADSVCNPGDTAWISVKIIYPQESRRIQKQNRYRVLLGSQPKRYQDNVLLRYTSSTLWRKDSLVSTQFRFRPDHPVPAHELSIVGDFELEARFTNGDSVTATGRYEDGQIKVELDLATQAGPVQYFQIRWNALGKLLFQSKRK